MIALVALAACVSRPVGAESPFLKSLHKAESRKEPAEQVEYLNRAVKAWEPEEGTELLSHAHLLRGTAYYWLNQFAAAEPDLSKAVELDPGSALAYLLRGRIKLKQGKLADAQRDLREYAGLKADDLEGWLALSEAQLKAADADAAEQSCKRAAQLDPSDWRVQLGRARVAMARKAWPEAVESLDAAQASSKSRAAEVFSERAICRVGQGRPEDALADYDLALPLYDRDVERATRGGAAKLEAVEAQDKAARAYFGRGRVNEFLARLQAAVQDYRDACRLGHQQACARAEAVVPEPPKEAPAPKAAAPREEALAEPKGEPPRPPEPKKERRRRGRVDSDAGDRIYAN